MSTARYRTLAIAIRARWLGFAVLDGTAQLIDWGMVYYQRKDAATLKRAKQRAELLIHRIGPSRLVLLLPESQLFRDVASVRAMTRAVRTSASHNSIPCHSLIRDDVRAGFSDLRSHSKDGIAAEIARRFPELAGELPPQRKTWKKEDSRLAIFDAIAAALVFASSAE